MKRRARSRARVAAVVALGAAPAMLGVATGCFQEIDPGAASGAGLSLADGGDEGADLDALSTWQLCQSPSCDLPSGEVPFLDETPPVYLPDGGTTTNPCDDVEQASIAVRQAYCAGCHQAPASQGGVDFILDDGKLLAAVSQTQTDDAGKPLPLLVPGDPAHSWLYVQVAHGMNGASTGMPPLTLAGYSNIPRPGAMHLSLLYAWIMACLPGTDAGAYALQGGGDYAPGGDAAVGASGDAGVVPDPATDGAPLD